MSFLKNTDNAFVLDCDSISHLCGLHNRLLTDVLGGLDFLKNW